MFVETLHAMSLRDCNETNKRGFTSRFSFIGIKHPKKKTRASQSQDLWLRFVVVL
jgi:hypothetical protein